MHLSLLSITALVATLGMASSPASAQVQVATIDTAAKLLPPGPYQCKLGSYAFRDCEIVAKGAGTELVLPPGLGHFLELRAELLPSDDKNQLTLLGRPTSAQNLCDTCPPGAVDSDTCTGGPAVAEACKSQPLVARLKVTGGTAKGTLLYYIVRPSYTNSTYTGYFKLGNTVELTVRPKKTAK
jgi:hypothetical protein